MNKVKIYSDPRIKMSWNKMFGVFWALFLSAMIFDAWGDEDIIHQLWMPVYFLMMSIYAYREGKRELYIQQLEKKLDENI